MSGDDAEYEEVDLLGEGAFGKVYLVKDKTTNSQYAMKVIDLTTAPQDERDIALKEAQLLSEFKHTNILQYVNSFEDGGALCIVTEFCPNGDIAGYLEKRNNRALPESLIVQWFREVTSALEYLHGRNVLHRDIKTQNIFLMSDNSSKLGDMGLARVLERPNAKAVTFCGSPYYMSPEIFSCKPYDSKSDIWALGVVVYEMATLEKPFEAMLMHQLVFKIVHGEQPDMPKAQYSRELISVMEKMLEKDPENRPTSSQILAQSLFKKTLRPKTPPAIAPKPKTSTAESKRKMASVVKLAMGKSSQIFDMGSLLSALSVVQAHKKAKEKAAGGKKQGGYQGNFGIQTIMKDTFIDKTKADKTIKGGSKIDKAIGFKKPDPKGARLDSSDSSTNSDDSGGATGGDLSTFGAQDSRSTQHMMNLVVRTLTQMFNKDDRGKDPVKGSSASDTLVDPETLLLRQIDQLQYHCVKILGLEKFRDAYDMLGQVRDNRELEERLIGVIGQHAFAQCGVQLFYCKNFEYNLEKLKNDRYRR